MPINDFLPFAIGVGANVMTQAEYDAMVARLAGFQGGIARSREVNKALRQSAAMTAALAQLAGNISNLDTLDNGNIAALETVLRRTMRHISAGIRQGLSAGAHTLTAAQMGFAFVGADGGNVTINLPSAAAQDGHPMRLTLRRWDLTGNAVTVNASAGQTIAGLTSFSIQPGQTVSLMSDGINQWVVAGGSGRLLNVRVFEVSGTYVPTPGMTSVIVHVQGGGASGGGGVQPSVGNVSMGAPGTAGTYARGRFMAGQVGTSLAITVGAGASAQIGGGGLNGGTSSFGALLTCPGGVGGPILNNQVAPTVVGNGTASAVASGTVLDQRFGVTSSATIAVSAAIGTTGPGGASPFGQGGHGTSINSNGADAVNKGAGGAGCLINNGGGGNYRGGHGAPGIVMIEEFG